MNESLAKQLHDLVDIAKFQITCNVKEELDALEEMTNKLIENQNQETPKNT